MNRIEISEKNWSVNEINESTDKIFIFGDNTLKIDKFEGLSNIIELRIKKGFFNDEEYESNCGIITEDLLSIRSLWLEGKTIVFSKDGYGNELTNLEHTAPKTYKFLVDVLRDFFEFDNKTGNIWKKTPSIDEVNTAKYVDFLKSNQNIIIPVNNSYFKEEFLKSNINSNYELVKNDKKVSFLSKEQFKKGDCIMMKFDGKENYLFVKVCLDSYKNEVVDFDTLSNFEGYLSSFFIDKNIDDFFQTQIKYICEISDKGQIIFKDDLFTKEESKTKGGETVGFPIFKQEESDDIEELIEQKKPTKSIFKNPFRKSFVELLKEKNLYGEITKIDNVLSQIKRESYQVKIGKDYYYIVFYKHLFTNSIEVLSVNKKPFL